MFCRGPSSQPHNMHKAQEELQNYPTRGNQENVTNIQASRKSKKQPKDDLEVGVIRQKHQSSYHIMLYKVKRIHLNKKIGVFSRVIENIKKELHGKFCTQKYNMSYNI